MLEAGPEPNVVANYMYPGGNQYLAGNVDDFARRSVLLMCDQVLPLITTTTRCHRRTSTTALFLITVRAGCRLLDQILNTIKPGGRGLGGSSLINGLYYGRGSASVFDHWVDIGNPGWGWDDLYPLSIKVSTQYSSQSVPS